MYLKVNEIFGPTIQGEGKSVGKEVVFIRLAGCNLKCIWCDTPYTWDWEHFNPVKEIHQMAVSDIFIKVANLSPVIKSIVISGGEPFLQQSNLLLLAEKFKSNGFWIEIETNGTVMPKPELISLVNQINCSPKLSNSGNSKDKRIREQVLFFLGRQKIVNFKFVVSTGNDLEEVNTLVERFHLSDIYLMPQGKTRDEQLKNQEMVRVLCSIHRFKFSPRAHILKWDQKRAV